LRFALRCCRLSTLFAVSFLGSLALAAPSSDTILPKSTKGFVSVARAAEFQERWDKTQIGQMLADEVMQPFIEDAKKQLRDKYPALKDKLGLDLDDLDGVSAGEMSLAILERKAVDAALAITIDVSGRAQQAAKLMAAIEKRFADRGARKETVDQGGTKLTVFTMKAANADAKPQQQVTVYFTRDNILCGVDDRAEATAMSTRFTGTPTDNLKSVLGYKTTMDRCRAEAKNLAPEARWYVDPFGFVFAVRTLQKSSIRPNEQDTAKILYENGFDAIEAAGGFINLLVEGHIEIVDRTAVYAPPSPGMENDPLRWTKSMRMLQLPNADGFQPQSWVPRLSANYATFQLEILAAFDNLGPLFDAMQDHENAWKNTLDAWANDPYGAHVDVRREFIQNMGQRITLLTDYDAPITVDSERSLFAIEAKNEAALATALEKWMAKENNVVRRNLGPYVVWERTQEAIDEVKVSVPGFTTIQGGDDNAESDDKLEPVLPNSAVTVALGHMMMASDINYLTEILGGFGQRDMLASAGDYQQVVATVKQLAPGPHSVLIFGRIDEEVRPTFELIRAGKMPEAKTMLGKALNNLLTTEVERTEGHLRKQRVDGTALPNFEAVRRYLGPAGHVVRSDKDGWFITGAVLNKEAP
jgi:hypothetical protein